MDEPFLEGVYERKRPMRKFGGIYLFLHPFGLDELDASDSPALASPVL